MEKTIQAKIQINTRKDNPVFCSPLCRFYVEEGYCSLFRENLPYIKIHGYKVYVRCLQCMEAELETEEGKKNKYLKKFYEEMKAKEK